MRQHQGCTRAPEAQRTRRSALEDPGLRLLSWSSDGCADGQAVCASLLGAQAQNKAGGRAQGAWRAEVGGSLEGRGGRGGPGAAPRQDRATGKPPRTQLVPTAGGQRRQGSREAGAVRLRLEVSSGPAPCAGAETPPLPAGSTKKTQQRKEVPIKRMPR